MLTTLLAAALSTPLSGAPAPSAPPAWEHFVLENGIQVSSLVVGDAENQSFFTLLPLGLLADDAHRTQYAHLVEHMLIRSTDPDSLLEDGLRLNGETTALTLRLESIGPAESFREALERHARWLAADRFDEQVLAREQQRMEQELDTTLAGGFTAKWADAAWNQIVRHGLDHAAVRLDPASATVSEVREYVQARVPVSAAVQFVSVGPVPAEQIRETLETTLGELAPREAAAGVSPFDGEPIEREATWDLEARHYLEWYPLPDRGVADRAGSVLLSQLVNAALMQDARLSSRGIQAHAAADLITPEGRFLKLTAGFKDEADLPLIREAYQAAIADPLATLHASGDAAGSLTRLSEQLTALPDFQQLRKRLAGKTSSMFLEAQVALTLMNHRITTGLPADGELKQAHAALTPETLAELARLTFRKIARSSLLLRPVE